MMTDAASCVFVGMTGSARATVAVFLRQAHCVLAVAFAAVDAFPHLGFELGVGGVFDVFKKFCAHVLSFIKKSTPPTAAAKRAWLVSQSEVDASRSAFIGRPRFSLLILRPPLSA